MENNSKVETRNSLECIPAPRDVMWARPAGCFSGSQTQYVDLWFEPCEAGRVAGETL